jgi:L,D-peptidoglycan transpeptidase YkuD (ErfK/YbiS/YcfS/YnhG family)
MIAITRSANKTVSTGQLFRTTPKFIRTPKVRRPILARVTAPGRTAGVLTDGIRRFPCAFGHSGITRFKREGDGKTPIGAWPCLGVFYRPDRVRHPLTGLPVDRLAPDCGWCDDPDHRLYNQPVTLPFAAHHEMLWRKDHIYDVIVVLGYNTDPAVRGLGSAIFLHIAGHDFAPTEGCLALARSHLLTLLTGLGPGSAIDIA